MGAAESTERQAAESTERQAAESTERQAHAAPSATAATASCCWNGGRHVFEVALDVNIRHTFGMAAFLVDDATQQAVSLDASGAPVTPLVPGRRYTLFTGSSKELKKQVGAVWGQLQAARHELSKLHERLRKFEACSNLGLEQLRAILKQQTTAPADAAQQAAAGGAHIESLLAAAASCGFDSAAAEPAAAEPAAAEHAAAEPAAAEPAASSAEAKPSQLRLAEPPGPRPPPAPPPGAPPSQQGEWSGLPIGWLRTCYVEKNGTPRQGCISSAPAELRVELGSHAARNGGHALNAVHALEGLEHFSHVWLLWIFDKNSGTMTKSKVKPPRLDGGKTGLFATRTPHRPNNLGLSLVRLDSVKGDTLHLSGVDLVDGTPILDVKPFLPFADTARGEEVRIAPWLQQMPTPDLHVELSAAAAAELRDLMPAMRLLKDEAQARRAIEEVLVADPRSVHWRQQRATEEFGFCIDTLNVVCTFAEGTATVTKVHHLHLADRMSSHMSSGSSAPHPQEATRDEASRPRQ